MNIGETIKVIRQKSLLSQSDFAKEIGVSFSAVNRWENGKSVPKISKLKLIKAFCVEHDIPFDIDDSFFKNAKGER